MILSYMKIKNKRNERNIRSSYKKTTVSGVLLPFTVEFVYSVIIFFNSEHKPCVIFIPEREVGSPDIVVKHV